MVERNYEPNWQQTVLAAGVELFGLQRVMVASNFPLCQFSSTYSAYWQQTLKIAEPKESELLFKNAYKFYRFA